MKFKHKGGEIDVNKKLLATYNDDQLAEYGEQNGIDPEDTVKLREKVGEAEPEEEIIPQPPKKKKK